MSVHAARGFSEMHSRGVPDTTGHEFRKPIDFRLGGGGEGGEPSCEQGSCGQNSELYRTGQRMVRTGEQMVQEGQRLIQQGDTEEGVELVNEGAMLEQQGAMLEAQAGGGPGGMPVGLNPGGPMMPPLGGGQDPCYPTAPIIPVGLNPGGQDPCFPMNPMTPPFGGGQEGPYGSQFPIGMDGCGGDYGHNRGGLSVQGNTVNTGTYKITASGANGGTLTVTGPGGSFTVWGDPHISTSTGGTADFQHAPATFLLGDGTRITVDPTNNPGVNTINNVTITKGNDAVTMTGFTGGNIQTHHLSGDGYHLDRTTAPGTVMRTENGNAGELTLANGEEIGDGNHVGNIDNLAANGNNSQLAGQIQQNLAQIEQAIGRIEQAAFMNAGFGSFGSKFG